MDYMTQQQYEEMAKEYQKLAKANKFYYVPLTVYGRQIVQELGVLPPSLDKKYEEYDYDDYPQSDDDEDTGELDPGKPIAGYR